MRERLRGTEERLREALLKDVMIRGSVSIPQILRFQEFVTMLKRRVGEHEFPLMCVLMCGYVW